MFHVDLREPCPRAATLCDFAAPVGRGEALCVTECVVLAAAGGPLGVSQVAADASASA